FPLVLDVRCARVTYAAAGDRVTAALGGMAATAPLYWPGAVDAKLDAPFVVNAPAMGVALTTSWSLATANATAGVGGLKGFGASFVSLKADNTGRVPGVPVTSLAAADANASIAPASGGSYTISAAARQLRLTRTDGSTYPDLDGEARITVVDVGSSLGSDPARTLIEWLRRGGTAKIERLKIAGVGAIVTSDGTLSLSAGGLLSGSVLVRWNDISALADLIEALLPGTREKFDVPLQGLNAVSIATETSDGPLRQTALTFTDGVIWLGIFPLPIDPIPPIRF
ncbi:MAG: DUF2125 domain-containing protein, partial [Bauldia sp.]|nr:DUF2125 domain-containing protein [Bauldia sp.]